MSELHYCKKCNRTMDGEQFYSSNNLEKYPDNGKFDICKKCMTMHVDNWDPNTYLWILEEADVPYVPDEWNKLMAKYANNPEKMTGMTVLGRYLSKMKLKQFKDYRWKDTAFLQELAQNKIEQTMKRSGYDAQQIAEAINKATFTFDEHYEQPPTPTSNEPEDYFDQQNDVSIPEETFDLTDEEKLMLRLKWGKTYKPEEWIKLEQLYNEFLQSYDIQSAGHIDTLKLICKTSLKANQLIDIGDVEGFQKMSRVYDNLMKSGKFTAAQNKAESGEYVNSVSELVTLCEQQGFIPRYYVSTPQDKVDETLQDTKNYVRTLVTEEMNLGNLIESSIRTMNYEENKEEDEDIEDEIMEDVIPEITDEDFMEQEEFLESEQEKDAQLTEELALGKNN